MGKVLQLSSIEKRKGMPRIALRGAHSWLKGHLEINGKLSEIAILNVSENGVNFDVTYTNKLDKLFIVGETHTVRFYVEKTKYIPIKFKVSHFKPNPGPKNLNQFSIGGKFDKSTTTFQSFLNLINFIRDSREFIVDANERTKKTRYR